MYYKKSGTAQKTVYANVLAGRCSPFHTGFATKLAKLYHSLHNTPYKHTYTQPNTHIRDIVPIIIGNALC